MSQPLLFFFIKTTCGRAKYNELVSRKGILSKIRLSFFVLIAILKDWNIENPEEKT